MKDLIETMDGEREELEDIEVSDSAGERGGDKEHSLCDDLKLRSRGVSMSYSGASCLTGT